MKHFIPLMLLVTLFLGSCALVLTGSKQRLQVTTREPGAEVWHNGRFLDSTPCIIQIKRSYEIPQPIEIKKSGFVPERVVLKKGFNEVAALNFVLPWNWLIDGFSGAVVRYKNLDTITLKPLAN